MTATAPEATVVDVEFASSPPGLAPHTTFLLERIPQAEGLYALRAAGAPVRLFLLDPLLIEGVVYAPRLSAAALAEIGAADDGEALLFVVANPSEEGVHVNLRAPVVIHRETGRAVQMILEDQDQPIRMLLGATPSSAG
ncbi:flagellar assembly protein FliW [Microbacterium sp. ASV81]|uniref:Flagellar assembly protein FliW n=1 Tax=Microbacterium capsulatum TaxID=3041921 RepID=A0ABU0XDN0_9MICO|nr:flagellar assembly protein FliW [Microbacterium sp. ASV81]MDQ4213220.1 flagellar assembly protein FliW [Microbacterium sp. ASV81]